MSKQLSLPLSNKRLFTQKNFMVASCNFAAVELLGTSPNWTHFALLLYGAPGCGKSHLAKIWADKQAALQLDYLPEQGNFLSARLGKRNLLVEDIDKQLQVPHQPAANEEKLLHFLNNCVEEEAKLLLTAASTPSQWQLKLPDLRSRLLAVPTVQIHAPGLAFLGRFIEQLFATKGIRTQNGLGNYLALRIPRSFSEAHRIVAALDLTSLQQGRQITIDLARRLVNQLYAH